MTIKQSFFNILYSECENLKKFKKINHNIWEQLLPFFLNMRETLKSNFGDLSTTHQFANNAVEILTAAPNQKIPVLSYLRNPNEFHGDPNVDHVVLFGEAFVPLIGKFDESRFGKWDPERLPEQGIVVLEHYYRDAAELVQEVDRLAQRIIQDNKLYDDKKISDEYYALAQTGYHMLFNRADEFGIGQIQGAPVSLERAGLVTTRLALGLGKDDVVPGELRVVTKRTHLDEEPENHLTVTVNWRDRGQTMHQVDNKPIDIADFVNPASGASTAAFLLACKQNGVSPSQVTSRSFSLTRQGTLFMKQALEGMGMKPIFYSVGECDEMNGAYYLMGKAVADAGHILRHHLPQSLA